MAALYVRLQYLFGYYSNSRVAWPAATSDDAFQIDDFLAGADSPVLPGAYMLDIFAGNQVGEGYVTEEVTQTCTQIRPQIVRQTDIPMLTVALAQATGRVHRVVNRLNDLRHIDSCRPTGQAITATRPAHTLNQLAAAQLGEQLLQIGHRYALAQRYVRQRDGALILVEGQVQHCCNRITAFGGQTHNDTRVRFSQAPTMQYPTILVNY